MDQNFWKEDKISQKKIISPNVLIPIAVAGILIIVISIILENYFRSEGYLKLLSNQAKVFITALNNSSQTTLQAADELESEIHKRMQTNLRLIAALHELTPFSKEKLKYQQNKTQFESLYIFDKEGKCIVYSADSDASGEIIPQDILININEGLLEEIIIAPEDYSESSSNRFIALVHRQDGGSVAGIISAEYIQTFRRLYGFGRFFKDFKKVPGVEYFILENPETIIAGIFEPYQISGFYEDKFLYETMKQNDVMTRVLQYEQQSIFEAVAPFIIQNEPVGVLRLGLSMQDYEILNARAKRRLVITGLAFLVIGVSLLSFYLSYRQRHFFKEGLIRLQKYTNVILENMGSGVIAVGNNGNIQLANKQAANILNIIQDDVIDKKIGIFPEEIAKICRESIDTGKEVSQPRFFWYNENSEQLRISIRTTLLKKDSSVEICILLLDDTTEQARLEEQLRRQEKLTAMGKLASGVAHEIRNPLNSISLIIQLLGRKYKPAENIIKYSEYINTVGKEINRINDIVTQFIKFARPPAIHKKPLEFNEFFREIEQLFMVRLKENQIKFELNVDSHPLLEGDHDQLKQVFINLVENSIQAIETPGAITVKGRVQEDFFEILLKDSGKGISKNHLPNIFDIYFTTKEKGTGIGLSVVHQIISGHGGTIEVESKQSQGTTFIIHLPFMEKVSV